MNERVQAILADLETIREQLLAFADDVWLGIDHRNAAQLAGGVQFIQAYNDQVAVFDAAAAELSTMIQQFTHTTVESELPVNPVDVARNERIIRELDRATPHTLDEDFTYKRPYGFVFRGRAFTEIATWKRLYAVLCQQLAELDPARFDALPSNPTFISPQDKHAFSRDRSELRSPLHIARGIYAEAHYSANSIRDNMKALLQTFAVSPSELRIYLRQDRDAGRDSVA